MNEKYQVISSETKFQGKIIITKLDFVRMPDGLVHDREFVEHPGAVGMVPVTKDGKVILVKQYRHPTGKELLEIPAGKLRQGEDPLLCAGRELIEETGFRGKLSRLAEFYTTPGYSNEYFYLFIATDLEDTGIKPSDQEIVELTTMPLAGALQMIDRAEITDGKSIAGLYLAERFLRSE